MLVNLPLRDVISNLLLTLDEIWLTYGERSRMITGPSKHDVQLEEALFKVEARLLAAEAAISRRNGLLYAEPPVRSVRRLSARPRAGGSAERQRRRSGPV